MNQGGHDSSDRAKYHDQKRNPQAKPSLVMPKEVTIPTIIWKISCVLCNRLGVLNTLAIHRYVLYLDRLPAMQHRGVRISLDVSEGVMLTVHRDPFFGLDAC